MPKQYCNCGHPNEYSLSKPKFCGGCGQPLMNSGVASVILEMPMPRTTAPVAQPAPQPVVVTYANQPAPKVKRRIQRAMEEEEEYDDEEPIEISVPNKIDLVCEDLPEMRRVPMNVENVFQGGPVTAVENSRGNAFGSTKVTKKARKERVEAIQERCRTTERRTIGE